MKVYKLTFKSPLHIGTGDEDNNQTGLGELLRSDTIFGSVMSSLNLLGETDIEKWCKEPPFLVSSAFPCKDGIRFYPKPAALWDDSKQYEEYINNLKFWKKLDFIPESVFIDLMKGKPFPLKSFQEDFGKYYSKGGTLDYYSDDERPRLAIDMLSGSAEENRFFYSRDRFFKKGWSLYFLVEFKDPSFENLFSRAMLLLSENGFGADRSIGRGNFSVEEITNIRSEIVLSSGNSGKGFLLSLYFPSEDEIKTGLLEKSKYTLIRRGGYTADFRTSGTRRKTLVMLGEGSILDLSKCSGGVNEIVLEAGENVHFNTFRYGTGFIIKWDGGK